MAAEKNYENKVKKYLEENGAYFIKYWAGAAYTKSGIPDILACVNGHFLGIELKAPNGKPSPLQIHNLKKIDEAGGYAILLYPNQWEVFKNFVESILNNDIENETHNYKLLKGRWSN